MRLNAKWGNFWHRGQTWYHFDKDGPIAVIDDGDDEVVIPPPPPPVAVVSVDYNPVKLTGTQLTEYDHQLNRQMAKRKAEADLRRILISDQNDAIIAIIKAFVQCQS